mmetsp:Transcript_25170/g.38992  ORF Transcript_25170/g.38992 Transcript_25170/m.38992 type:complete len:89 (+) Transcript_25170:268-534(+)
MATPSAQQTGENQTSELARSTISKIDAQIQNSTSFMTDFNKVYNQAMATGNPSEESQILADETIQSEMVPASSFLQNQQVGWDNKFQE